MPCKEATPSENGHPKRGNYNLDLDALIVGAGFSGCLLLYKLREELSLNVRVFEASSGLGGTWQNNRAWKKWTWQEKYPGYAELQSYFAHLDRELSLSKDCVFNCKVVLAKFDEDSARWYVETASGTRVRAKYLIPAIGFASKPHTPAWNGLDSFRGRIYHSSAWPANGYGGCGVDVRGKRVAVIGTGSTGIQIIQQWAKEADEVYVFQRTPNTALPMRQERLLDSCVQKQNSDVSERQRRDIFKKSLNTFGGLSTDCIWRNALDDTPGQREATYESLYTQGGLGFWNASYQDLMSNSEANLEAYRFWARKTRARIDDPKLKDLLVPLVPLHAFAINKPHVHLIDVRETPILGLAPSGIMTNSGTHKVDIIAIATGFDSVVGGIRDMGIKDADGVPLDRRWDQGGISSYLGMMVSRCPNMFLPYSAHSPSVFSNGPTTIELQASWIMEVIGQMERRGVAIIDVKKEAEQAWIKEVADAAENTLVSTGNSWYMGANIPGRRVEPLFFMGGLPRYRQRCREALDSDLHDFHLTPC
ncbi:FAD/NAD(P)-binding domain-containing protein [Aspergillus insuetus]